MTKKYQKRNSDLQLVEWNAKENRDDFDVLQDLFQEKMFDGMTTEEVYHDTKFYWSRKYTKTSFIEAFDNMQEKFGFFFSDDDTDDEGKEVGRFTRQCDRCDGRCSIASVG